MNKPKPQNRNPVLDYREIIHYIEKKYDVRFRDYGRRDRHHAHAVNTAAELVGGDKSWYTTAPTDMNETQMKAHDKYKELKQNEPPYLNHWHYMLDNWGNEVSNGCDKWWDIEGTLECEGTPKWIKELTQLVYDEFKEHLDESGGLEVHISW